jgi:uncharacterized protein
MIHHSFWQGDILSIYVPLGFILLALRKLNNKWVLVLGIALALNVPGKVVALMQMFNPAKPGGFSNYQSIAQGYNDLVAQGGLLDLFKYHWTHLSDKANFQVDSGRIYITMGFFLLGMFVGRMRWFEKVDESRGVFRKICKRSAAIMAIMLVCGLSMMLADTVLKLGWQQNAVAGFVFMLFYDIFNASLVVVIVSGVTLLMYKRRGQKFFYPMASVGKMALTSYLTQTAFGLILFYNIGFGVYTKTSPGFNYLIAICFFILQMQFSKWWLSRFNYGPVEWLWRSGTLLKWQPMMKQKQEAIPAYTPVVIPESEAVLTN